MELRKFEKLGITTSLLGFGCMRFPQTPDGKIDEIRSMQMIDEAWNAGVTYYDTAYPYHDGLSEAFVGKAMKKYNREDYTLATKLPIWLVKEKSDVRKYFEEQLERLQTDYIDLYLIHAMDRKKFDTVKNCDVVQVLCELKKEGKIRGIGFSFHDEYEVYDEIVHYHDWDFCQLQINYVDTEIQAGMKGYEVAKELGIPVIVMEPVKGGLLANLSPDLNGMLHELNPNVSIASYAFRWVASHSNVITILSGMSTEEQVRDNIKTFSCYEPMTEKEFVVIDQVADKIKARVQNGCTGCQYCLPCPVGINIPYCFDLWNRKHMFPGSERPVTEFAQIKEEHKPSNCILCGKCEKACPQKIEIREDLKKVSEDLS